MASDRVPEIDLLRFVAAAAVVGYHNSYRIPVHGIPSEDALPILQSVTKFGYLGVALFFLISGFVILWSASAKTARQFVMSRALRLYPSFWASVAITTVALLILGPSTPDAVTIAGNVSMLPGYADVEFIDGVYWTLAVEIKFYALVALVLLAKQIHRMEYLLWAWLIGLSLCHFNFPVPGLVSISMFPYGQLFAGGCWAFLIRSKGSSPSRFAGFFASLLLGVAAGARESKNFLHEPSTTDLLIVEMLIVLCFGVILSVALRWWTLRRTQLAMTLGALTYPLYLLHNRIGKLLYAAMDGVVPTWLAIFIITGVGVGLAVTVTALVEKRLVPFLGRTKTYRRLSGSANVPPADRNPQRTQS
jgi:peptidoglycan/LPS O-acetylase OafA/YrhL